MRVLVQWARSRGCDWDEIDSREWTLSPFRDDPTGRDLSVDDGPGWVAALNVQGVCFEGYDHYAVEHLDDETVRVVAWTDTGPQCIAHVWTIKPLACDPIFGGAYNTRQQQIVYTDDPAPWSDRDVRPWSDFVPPVGVRHGKMLPDDLWDAHRRSRRPAGWREWTEGVPADELVGGRVPAQRFLGRWPPAKGTRTYYCSTTALATGVHVASNEFEASSSTGSMVQDAESVAKASQELTHVWTTAANEPNSADWPSGNYRCQLDVSAAGADLTYGFRTLTSAAGHFARVNSGLTADQQTWAQAESAFSGTGLKLATTGTIDPTAGVAGDRWECLLAVANASTMSAESITLDLNESDDYTDGPWAAGTTYVGAQVCSSAGAAAAATVSPGAVGVPAGVTSAAGTAPNATVASGALQVDAEVTSAAGTSVNATVTPGAVNVPAGVAGVSGSAPSATVSPGAVQVPAEVVQVAGAPPDAAVVPGAVQVLGQVAAVTGAAPNVTVSPGAVQAPSEVAAAVGAAPNAGVVSGAIAHAEVTGAAGTAMAAGAIGGPVHVPLQSAVATSHAPNVAAYSPSFAVAEVVSSVSGSPDATAIISSILHVGAIVVSAVARAIAVTVSLLTGEVNRKMVLSASTLRPSGASLVSLKSTISTTRNRPTGKNR